MNKGILTKQIKLEFLGHIFKSRQEYSIAIFGFYAFIFFVFGLLIGLLINFIFKSFKPTNNVRLNAFLIGLWSVFLGAYLSSDYLYITKKAHVVIDLSLIHI